MSNSVVSGSGDTIVTIRRYQRGLRPVQELLGICYPTLNKWLRQGRLDGSYTVKNGRYTFDMKKVLLSEGYSEDYVEKKIVEV